MPRSTEDIWRDASSLIEDNYKRYIEVLGKLVSVRTVSAWGDPAEMRKGAELVSSLLRDLGFTTSVKSYGGHPLVTGELGEGSTTIMIYNHYDVQPPDPLDQWRSDPFRLEHRDGKLYGRGVADNKGNIAARLGAIESLLPFLDDLDLRIKYVVEGEEEIGSPTLLRAAEELGGWLQAHGGFWETGYIDKHGRLRIPLGYKGMVYVEIRLRGTSRDTHSGYAPLVPNPAWRLAKLLTLIKDEDGRIKVEWLYRGMWRPGAEEERLLEELGTGELEELREELGLKRFAEGLEGMEALRKLHLYPSINVSGLYAGYTGPGSKTIVPMLAGAKIDIRPVPGQDPEELLRELRSFLQENGFSDAEIKVHSAYPSGHTSPSAGIVRASVEAVQAVYGSKPVLIPLSPGSGPIYVFTNMAGIPMTGAGVGYYGSKTHAPNENIRVEDFEKSMKHVALTIIKFAEAIKKRK
jgi:acetylornithine deacetylase/succinyl-diaminopimelate desuccinylase-like protein